jgi:hypothetical protein
VTPFVGNAAADTNGVAAQLVGGLARSSGVIGEIAVPGHETADGRTVVEVPRHFLVGWAEAWGVHPERVPVLVPPRARRGEKAQRDLHAKCVVLESADDDRALLLAGSSNFTMHGMGVSVSTPNLEANLCFVARLDACLRDRAPVDWDADLRDDAVWLDEPDAEVSEDAPPSTDLLPPVFRWATLDPRRGSLAIRLDPASELPATWAVRLPGRSASTVPALAEGTTDTARPPDGVLRVELAPELRAASFTCVRLEWSDEDGAARSAPLPVQVADLGDLLPPSEFRGLSADAILDALLSGREPADLLEGSDDESTGVSAGAALESLRAVDTSNWTLYRVRRLGRALAGLGERLLRTIRTQEAISHRLRHDPLGPIQLGEALVREWLPPAQTRAEKEPVVFGLAEIALTVVQAGARLHADRDAGEPDLRPAFRDAADRLFDMCVQQAPASRASQVIRYMRDVRALARKRLG